MGQGRFLKVGHHSCFFQINSDKLKARVAIVDLRGLKFYIIFNDTIVAKRYSKVMIFMGRGHKSVQNGLQD